MDLVHHIISPRTIVNGVSNTSRGHHFIWDSTPYSLWKAMSKMEIFKFIEKVRVDYMEYKREKSNDNTGYNYSL